MKFDEKIKIVIENLKTEKIKNEEELASLEADLANVKLNPYGITSIDFSKRQELATDIIKMEGTLMGLELALETYEELTMPNVI